MYDKENAAKTGFLRIYEMVMHNTTAAKVINFTLLSEFQDDVKNKINSKWTYATCGARLTSALPKTTIVGDDHLSAHC